MKAANSQEFPTLRDPDIPAPPIALIAAMPAIAILASLIYMPSIKSMAAAFAVEPEAIQQTVAIYLASLATFSLVAGPLSDRFGRQRVCRWSVLIFMLGSLGTLFSDSIGELMLARLIQGMGASGGFVLPRAMINDALHSRHAARASATIAMSISIVPMLTPLIGGYIQEYFGWRANFLIVSILAVLLWIATRIRLNETLPPARRFKEGIRALMFRYAAILGNRKFLIHSVPIALGAFAIYSYHTEAPVLLIATMGVPATEYGYYAALPALGFFFGTSLSRRLAFTVARTVMIESGCALYVASGALMLTLSLLLNANPLSVAAPMLLFGIGNGLVMPNASIGAISAAPALIGCASALSSALRIGSGAAGSSVITHLPTHSAQLLGAQIGLAGLAALLLWLMFGRSYQVSSS
ncbi:MAG: multidrug effflux MFS transporter [Burkholderiaceae bacterium]